MVYDLVLMVDCISAVQVFLVGFYPIPGLLP